MSGPRRRVKGGGRGEGERGVDTRVYACLAAHCLRVMGLAPAMSVIVTVLSMPPCASSLASWLSACEVVGGRS